MSTSVCFSLPFIEQEKNSVTFLLILDLNVIELGCTCSKISKETRTQIKSPHWPISGGRSTRIGRHCLLRLDVSISFFLHPNLCFSRDHFCFLLESDRVKGDVVVGPF